MDKRQYTPLGIIWSYQILPGRELPEEHRVANFERRLGVYWPELPHLQETELALDSEQLQIYLGAFCYGRST
jgi:hypothetical protein